MPRFLISGMPRCRTAWLTALFNALGTRCYHDVELLQPDWRKSGINVIDPTVALVCPDEARGFDKVISLHGGHLPDRLRALEVWSGNNLPHGTKELYAENWVKFDLQADIHVHVEQLNDNDYVSDLYQYVTGEKTNADIIEIFQLLKIEEHYPKAKALLDQQRGT